MSQRWGFTALLAAAAIATGFLATLSNMTIAAVFVFAVVLILLARLDSWQRLYAVTIFLLFAATSSQPQIAAVAYYPRYVAAGALAFWTWHHHRHEARKLADLSKGLNLLVKGLWLAVAVAALSVTWSVDRTTTAAQSIALAFLALIVHGLVARRWANTERISGDLGVAAVLLSTMFAVGIAAGQVGLVGTHAFGGRFQGLYNNPNTLGMTCALILPICWGLWRHTGKKIYLLAAIPTALSLILCQSRTAVLAVVIGALWVLARKGPGKAIRVAIAAAFTGTVVYLTATIASISLPLAFSDLSTRFTANQGGDLLNARTLAWSDSITLWQARPAGGYGYASGPSLFEQLRGQGLLDFGRDVVHNSYLQWLLELGVVGLLPLIVLVLACFYAARGRVDALGSGLVSAVVAGLLIQTTESAMFGTGQAYPFIFWLAVAGVLARTAPTASATMTDSRPKRHLVHR